jgi:hypothetical protein
MDINNLQTLIERGLLLEAIALVDALRLSSIELRATIEQKLADTRRDISSVDWNIPGEMDNLLKGARDRIEQSQPILSTIKDEIGVRIDTFEDMHVRSFPLEDPRRDEYYQLRDLYWMLEDCYLVHVQLHNPLIGARSVFLDEQLRQSFSFLELQC